MQKIISMNLIIIGSDPSLLSKDTSGYLKLLKYTKLFNRIVYFNFSKHYTIRKTNIFKNNLVLINLSYFRPILFLREFKKVVNKYHLTPINSVVTAQDPFILGLLGLFVKRAFKYILSIQVHTDFLSTEYFKESVKNKIYSIIGRHIIYSADSIRVVSRRIANTLQKIGVLSEKIFILPICIDPIDNGTEPIFNLEKILRYDLRFLIMSRIVKSKNISMAIDAFSILRGKTDKKVALLIVGDGPDKKEMMSFINKSGSEEHIYVYPHTNNPKYFYGLADIFLLSSSYEGWGMTILEALKNDNIIVMTDVGCAGELVINGKNGFVVPVSDTYAMSLKLLQLVESEELRKKIKAGIRVTKLDKYSEVLYLSEYRKYYSDLLIKK